jgi:hypothetical protein
VPIRQVVIHADVDKPSKVCTLGNLHFLLPLTNEGSELFSSYIDNGCELFPLVSYDGGLLDLSGVQEEDKVLVQNVFYILHMLRVSVIWMLLTGNYSRHLYYPQYLASMYALCHFPRPLEQMRSSH